MHISENKAQLFEGVGRGTRDSQILSSEMEVAYGRHICSSFYLNIGFWAVNSNYSLDSWHLSNSVLGLQA